MIPFDVTRRVGNPRFRSLSPAALHDFNTARIRRDIVRDNKRNQILYQPRAYSLRRVPAFTIQTEQRNTRPFTPISDQGARRRCHADMYTLCRTPPSPKDENLRRFQRLYEDRRFPIRLAAVGTRQLRRLEWLVEPTLLNAHDRREIFRRFAVGLPVEREPYSLIAVQGFRDLLHTPQAVHVLAESMSEVVRVFCALLQAFRNSDSQNLKIISDAILITSIRKGLNSRKTKKKTEMLELISLMTQLPGIGQLLLPFYRMLLPPLRIARATRISTDISTGERDRLRAAVDVTLARLEATGGENALLNIKYLIPDYQSQCISS